MLYLRCKEQEKKKRSDKRPTVLFVTKWVGFFSGFEILEKEDTPMHNFEDPFHFTARLSVSGEIASISCRVAGSNWKTAELTAIKNWIYNEGLWYPLVV